MLDADAHAVDLVGVGRPDAASGGADLALAQEALGDLVARAVVLRDDVRVRAHAQPRDVDAAGAERLELVEQHLEVDDDPVADDRDDSGRQDARGQQVQRVLLVADDDGVAGVVPAVELDDPVGAITQEVGGFSLALVPPLDADDHDCGHVRSSRGFRRYTPSYRGGLRGLACGRIRGMRRWSAGIRIGCGPWIGGAGQTLPGRRLALLPPWPSPLP